MKGGSYGNLRIFDLLNFNSFLSRIYFFNRLDFRQDDFLAMVGKESHQEEDGGSTT